jgi:DNA-binding GntR family transcriptional regulator
MPVPAVIERIERRPARLLVYERLRALIESGELAPGEVIKDTEVAAAIGTSRTPVREALKMLERDGSIEMLPSRLTRVTEISPDDVASLYAPLGALHGAAAELATPRAGRSDMARLAELNEQLLSSAEEGDASAARDADQAFHSTLLELAGNAYLLAAIEPLIGQARRLETLYFRATELGRLSYEDHRLILAAMERGDAAAAGEATRRNFERCWQPASRSS